MARSLRPNPRFDASQFQPTEDMLYKPVPIGGFGGEDRKSPLTNLDPTALYLVENLIIRFGAYETRDGTDAVGTVSPSDLLYACDVHLVNGSAYNVRWRVDGVDVLSAGVWVPATGDAFAGSKTWPFAITGWNDRILFSAGIGRMYELTFSPGFSIRQIPDSPGKIIHLATFNGRVMASIYGTRVQWSVKFDHTDWSGEGSGFEDLQSSAGGKPDQQTAIIPVSDELAYCVRTASVWQVGNTGSFDAPFSFTRSWTHVGSRLPQTCVSNERGFTCVGEGGQIWSVSPEGIEDIGMRIADDIDLDIPLEEQMSAAYDAKFAEYRLSIPSGAIDSGLVLRYSFLNKAWTRDIYPFPIKSIAYTLIVTGMSTDELVGTTDALVGATDDLGVPKKNKGFMYAMKDAARWVVRDEPLMTNTATKDINFDGTRIASGFRVESGDIRITDPTKRIEVGQLILLYEADLAMTFVFENCSDSLTWELISIADGPLTGRRTNPLSVDRSFERDHVQLAISTDVATRCRIVALQAMVREGARIVDAH
jgi:hypothetical protein